LALWVQLYRLRITHQNYLETGTKVYYSFRRVICISSGLSWVIYTKIINISVTLFIGTAMRTELMLLSAKNFMVLFAPSDL
ncbi:hypothetical protein, partial [Clostridium beijerinckii]|uniref:hypothetical protein n=1 Tax=Clostridium beijerinckii TaxID=1520 RepID=UPI001A9A43AB